MSSDPPNDDDDLDAWRQETEDVRPIERDERPARRLAPRPPVVRSREPAEAAYGDLPVLREGEAPGSHRRDWLRIRRGQAPIEARLDLHGHTREKAAAALRAFLVSCHGRGLRVVCVVTGRGLGSGPPGAVLRLAIGEWLNAADLRSMVLGYCAALPRDGGAGAVYVWLRRGAGGS